jgi:hypothetical protein
MKWTFSTVSQISLTIQGSLKVNISDNYIESSILKILYINRSNIKGSQKNTKLKLWNELLTLGFVKGTRGYVKLKGRMFNPPPHIYILHYKVNILSHKIAQYHTTASTSTTWCIITDINDNITSICSINHLKAAKTKKAEMMCHFRMHFRSRHCRHLPVLG